MRFFSSLVRPDESTGAVMRWVHRIWVFFWLTVLGAGIGLALLDRSGLCHKRFLLALCSHQPAAAVLWS